MYCVPGTVVLLLFVAYRAYEETQLKIAIGKKRREMIPGC